MDKLKIAKKVMKHAMKMKEKAETEFSCLYRTPDGNRCFIGYLIPNRLYSTALESKGVDQLGPAILAHIGAETDEDFAFLQALQAAHDDAEDIVEARKNLRLLIKRLEKHQKETQ